MKRALFFLVLMGGLVAVAAVGLERRESKWSGVYRIQPLELPEKPHHRAAALSAVLEWDASSEPP